MPEITDHLERRIAREIAARKAAERLLEAKSEELYEKNVQLEASSQRLTQAFELLNSVMGVVPDILITCNDKYIIEMANDASVGILGYDASELIGEHITKLFPSMSVDTMGDGYFMIPDIKMLKRDGTTIDTEVHRNIIEAQGRKFNAFVVQDTAALKIAEKMKEDIYWQLQEARRLEAMGALSGGIAHELNTPIQFISDNIIFIDNVLHKMRAVCPKFKINNGRCDEASTGNCALNDVYNCTGTLTFIDLIDDILSALKETREGVDYVKNILGLVKEFSHPGTGAPEGVDINTVIRNALAICRFRSQTLSAVEIKLAPNLPTIKCYPSQIQQVVINILINAVEAIEEQGREDGRVEISTGLADGHLRIEVSDNGPGIKNTLRGRVFDPFFTTKKAGKGTGQGLALAKDIIEAQHGGRLFLDERDGFATTFVIELPLDIPAANKARRMASYAHA